MRMHHAGNILTDQNNLNLQLQTYPLRDFSPITTGTGYEWLRFIKSRPLFRLFTAKVNAGISGQRTIPDTLVPLSN